MSRVEGNYGSSYYSTSVQQPKQESIRKSTDEKKVETTDKPETVKQPQLSTAAKKLLEKLQKKYSDMDIMVFGEGQDAKEILSRGTKEFSVIFSSEELEKMAANEKYEKEYMNRVQGAIRMSEEINKKYGYESAFNNKDMGEITKIGISFDKDGTMTFFAELEKSSNQQRERIENAREKHADEKKIAERKEQTEQKNAPIKKTIVQASSEGELIERMIEIDWSKVTNESVLEVNKFDYFI